MYNMPVLIFNGIEVICISRLATMGIFMWDIPRGAFCTVQFPRPERDYHTSSMY